MIKQCPACNALYDSTYVEEGCPHKEKGWKLSRLCLQLPETAVFLRLSPQEFEEWKRHDPFSKNCHVYLTVEVEPDSDLIGTEYNLIIRTSQGPNVISGVFPISEQEEPSSEPS
jgi:hypothetical protein